MLLSTALSLHNPAVALRRAITSASIALLGFCSVTANAQNAPIAPIAPIAPAPANPLAEPTQQPNPPTTSGRTRAEVVAELLCARESGEMDAALLRTYGLDMGTTVQPRHCTQAVASEASKREAQ